jgi:uncharacterized membrane protein
MTSRRSLLWLTPVGVAAALLACGDSSSDDVGDAGEACPVVVPCHDDRGTPNYAVPSYKTEIRPILQVACVPCHSSNGIASNTLETTYADVSNQVESMLDQAGTTCMMPPPNGPQISTAQRVVLDEWLSCGGPNN